MTESTNKEHIKDITKEYSPQEIETRVVKYFLDIFILLDLNKQDNRSGYDIIEAIRTNFNQTISPGTVYSVLYAIERKNLIKGESDGRKTVYTLTNLGKDAITEFKNSRNKRNEFMEKFFDL